MLRNTSGRLYNESNYANAHLSIHTKNLRLFIPFKGSGIKALGGMLETGTTNHSFPFPPGCKQLTKSTKIPMGTRELVLPIVWRCP